MSTLRSSRRYLSPRNNALGENWEAYEGVGKENWFNSTLMLMAVLAEVPQTLSKLITGLLEHKE